MSPLLSLIPDESLQVILFRAKLRLTQMLLVGKRVLPLLKIQYILLKYL